MKGGWVQSFTCIPILPIALIYFHFQQSKHQEPFGKRSTGACISLIKTRFIHQAPGGKGLTSKTLRCIAYKCFCKESHCEHGCWLAGFFSIQLIWLVVTMEILIRSIFQNFLVSGAGLVSLRNTQWYGTLFSLSECT